mgnify:CR=1 FL=1
MKISSNLNAYQMIPKALIKESGLSTGARFLYCYLSLCTTPIEKATLAAELNSTEKTISKQIAELETAGWILNTEDGLVMMVCNEEKKEYTLVEAHKQPNKRVLSKDDERVIEDSFASVWASYGRKGSRAQALSIWKKMGETQRSSCAQAIPFYCEARELQYRKDFQRYLKDADYDNVIFSKGTILYDPHNKPSAQSNTIWQ